MIGTSLVASLTKEQADSIEQMLTAEWERQAFKLSTARHSAAG
jgi:hypothetical protein